MLTRVFAAQAAGDLDFSPSDDCRPSQRLPIILQLRNGQRHLRPAVWGLQFDWAKRPLINARVETAADKPSFAPLFRSQRCIVPANAFHEWRDGERISFRLVDQPLFAMAGLWQLVDGSGYFTVLTTAPNELVAPLHDRMPVILNDAQIAPWLSGQALSDLARPYAAAAMSCT